MKTNKTRSICVYTCTIYTYMHHQIPPKYDIPSWPSLCTLWKTRSKWEICVESAVFVVFRCFSCAFHEKHHFSYKKCHFSWKQTKPGQYVCIHVHLHIHTPHLHHQIPPKYKIYLSWPSLCTLWNTRSKWEICVESAVFVAFHVLFIESAGFHTKSATFHENQQNQVNMCVYMHHLHIHAPPNTKIWYT